MRSALLLAAICLVAVVRIASTHHLFSPTYDEPLHVAAGWQFLSQHHYTKGTDNPPLARVCFAWPLRHARPTAADGPEQIGQIYESAGDYMRGVALSRRANLIFVVLAIIGTYLLAADLAGSIAGLLAALIVSMLPATLGLGGLATTDIAGTAAFALAMFAMSRWLGEPSWPRTALLGVAIAFLLLTKFTVALFFVIGAVALMTARRRWPLQRGAVASLIALALTYAVYLYGHAAPRFLTGVLEIIRHSSQGQDAYLLGEVRHTGWWYYFPVVLFVKTPLPVLLLAAIGARKQKMLGAIVLVILAVMMTSKADLGVRHILPVYVPLSILAASRSRWSVPLYAWLIAGSFLAHPDYLPWMNTFGGPHVVVDSNFDWGQDVVRLRDACRSRGISELGVALFGTADVRRIGLPPTHEIDPDHATPGWYAVSESFIRPAQARDPRAYRWLTERPFERVGKTIRLIRVD